MKRRRFLVGLCGSSVAGSFAVGSGAFSTVSAERSVSVEVAKDYEAYLKLETVDSGGRAILDGNVLEFSIPGKNEEGYDGGDPPGVGTDSVYRFGRDADGDQGNGLFTVENQGTQSVVVFSTQSDTDGVPSVRMYDVESGYLLTEKSPSAELGVGDQLLAGLEIDTHGVPVKEDEYQVSITINALESDLA